MSDSDDSNSGCTDSVSSGPDVNAPLKTVSLEDIKGRWLHSNSNIGLITVVPTESHAVLTDGSVWELQEKRNTVMMDEFAIVPKKSTLSELYWINTMDKQAKRYKWFFEDEGTMDISLDPAPQEKRKLLPTSDSDDERGSPSDSNDDDVIANSDEEAQEVIKTPQGEDAAPKMIEMFTEWILSTNTAAHEKRLARQGHLSKEFPIIVRGRGIHSLETKLAALGVTHEHINHRKTGTLIILKEAARKKFIEKHPEYSAHFSRHDEEESTPKRRKVDDCDPSPIELVESLQEQMRNANTNEILDVLAEMEKLIINAELLRKTKVGLDVNEVSKDKKLPETTRSKAAALLQSWKNIFRSQR